MAIQELYDPGYFDYRVQRYNGKVDKIKLQSPLLNQAVTGSESCLQLLLFCLCR